MPFCDVPTLLHLRDQGIVLLDVRSPAEFAAGHIPGAHNFPLLSNDERIIVGTEYTTNGSEAALDTGLRLLGPQLAEKLAQARVLLAGKTDVLLHCWRGGMRSRSVGWLLQTAGFRVRVLGGGYKRYRAHVRESLARPATMLVLGGMTGSGKTEVLHALAERGAQVIDLEGLAGHRGSAFGGVGLPCQGSTEMFENRLEACWSALDLSRPVWVEDEDRRIGDLNVSEAFFPHVAEGRRVVLRVPKESRAARLVRLYTVEGDAGTARNNALAAAVSRLEQRLGSEATKSCIEAIHAGRYDEAVRATLGYYDRAYEKQMARRRHLWVDCFDMPEVLDGPARIAAVLLEQEARLAASPTGSWVEGGTTL